jgi:hypothetical protein
MGVMGDNLARLLAAMYHAQDALRQILTENNGAAYYRQLIKHRAKLLSK